MVFHRLAKITTRQLPFDTLNNLAKVQLLAGRPHNALPLFERAVAIFDAHEGAQRGEHYTSFNLARALIAAGGDRTRGLALAQQARDRFRESGDAKDLAEAEKFLAKHDGGRPSQ